MNSSAPFFPVASDRSAALARGRRPTATAAKVALWYVAFAALWILLSDELLFAFTSDRVVLAQVALFKGWFFVAVSAGLLFWVLRAQLDRGREHEEKLRLFVDHAPVALAMLDRNLRYITVSRRWLSDYGLGDAVLRGRRHYDVFPDLPERWREAHRRGLAGETVQVEADCFERADGAVQWVRWELRPWLDANGSVGGIVLYTEDITERKQTADALVNSEARLRLALECGHVGTWSWEITVDQFTCDEHLARLLGFPSEPRSSTSVEHFSSRVHPEDRAAVQAAVDRALRRGTEFVADYRVTRVDGSAIWIANRASVERDAMGVARRMTGACADVTEAKRMERALHESEARFREVVETIREVFWITDVSKQRVIYVSPAYEEIWGRSCRDLYASPRDWLAGVHPEDRERALQAMMTKQMAGAYDETFRVIRPDLSVRWVRDQAFPVRDERGEIVRIVGVAEDITERKKLEEQFLHAQRLEAIGTLASGVAHDLNNILAPMLMIAPLLKPKLQDRDDREMLAIVEHSAQRGANVVRQLLTFSRGIAGERGELQLGHLAKEMIAIMRETFPREIGIAQDIASDLEAVVGDATQLHQVLMNLCVNARDAMPAGGQLTVSARNVVLDENALRGRSDAGPGAYVVLTVSDTGHGIPAEIRTRIFEPFFTTKAIGQGTGLGLSTALGIVKSHRGFLTLDSEPGHGTSFHVHLPASGTATEPGVTDPLPSLSRGNGELVLIVDDEPAVRAAMQHVLERQGYSVLAAGDGRAGLRLFLAQRDRVCAVVADLMMPEMGGVALVAALRELCPSLAILAATGLDDAEKRGALNRLGVTEILPKPYAPAELLDRLERVLRRVPPAAG